MNDDLISRSALLERAEGGTVCWFDIKHAPAVDPEEVFKRLPYVKEALEMAKQTVAPVRHGRWVSKKCNHKPCRIKNPEKWVTYKCSVCGYSNGRKQSNYCPNCGAKMERGTALSEAEPLAGCADDADLEHMTRFAMQQAIKQK